MKAIKETTSAIPQMVILPSSEWESFKQDILFLKESFEKKNILSLGDWLSEQDAQQLLSRKHTSLWRLRRDGVIFSKKIGSRNYYSKKSIIEFLDSEI
jgi:hypothetical protein